MLSEDLHTDYLRLYSVNDKAVCETIVGFSSKIFGEKPL